jgi:hypothetical protein
MELNKVVVLEVETVEGYVDCVVFVFRSMFVFCFLGGLLGQEKVGSLGDFDVWA